MYMHLVSLVAPLGTEQRILGPENTDHRAGKKKKKYTIIEWSEMDDQHSGKFYRIKSKI